MVKTKCLNCGWEGVGEYTEEREIIEGSQITRRIVVCPKCGNCIINEETEVDELDREDKNGN